MKTIEDPAAKDRDVNQAARVLLAAEVQNQADEQHTDQLDEARIGRMVALAQRLGIDTSALGVASIGPGISCKNRDQ